MNRREIILRGPAAVALLATTRILTASANESPELSERWLAFGHLPTDEIWWRWDIMNGKIMGAGLVFPSRGAWHLSVVTKVLLESKYEHSFRWIRHVVAKAAKSEKFTLLGRLRDHHARDHDVTEVSASFAEIEKSSIQFGYSVQRFF